MAGALEGASEEGFERQPRGSVRERSDADESTLGLMLHGRGESDLFKPRSLDMGSLDASSAVIVGVNSISSALDWPKRQAVWCPYGSGFGREWRVGHQLRSHISRRGTRVCRPPTVVRNVFPAASTPHTHAGHVGRHDDEPLRRAGSPGRMSSPDLRRPNARRARIASPPLKRLPDRSEVSALPRNNTLDRDQQGPRTE